MAPLQFHQRLPQILQSLEMQLQKEEETKSKRAKKIEKKKPREICIAPNSVFLIFRILSAQNDSFHPKIYVIKCNYM